MTPARTLLAALALLAADPAAATTLRVATYNVDLSRDGPGLLLHDLRADADPAKDPALDAVLRIVRLVRPDVLVLQKFDHDLRGRALAAFAARLAEGPDGIDYPHRFHAPVNAGRPSRLDLDGDGLTMGWADGLGFGKFPGHGGMAILSRLPIDDAGVRTFRTLLWQDLPNARLPARPDGTPFPSAAAEAILPLSSRSHWDVPVLLPGGGRLHVLTANPTPPLFDGPEGANRLRNHDEVAFWSAYLDGYAFVDDQGRAGGAAAEPFVLAADLNLDPSDGAGEHAAARALLAHPRLRDPAPASAGAAAAAAAQGGANAGQAVPAAQDTADWRDDPGPGNLRVDYVLPAAELAVTGSGVFWPGPGEAGAEIVAAGPPHRLVWVDLDLP
jgi:hypothetical protein